MQLKQIKFGSQFVGNITVFKQRFAVSKEDAQLIGDLIKDSSMNICFNSVTKIDPKCWYSEHAVLTVGGAISPQEYAQVMEMLHTASHKHHAKKLDAKFHWKK